MIPFTQPCVTRMFASAIHREEEHWLQMVYVFFHPQEILIPAWSRGYYNISKRQMETLYFFFRGFGGKIRNWQYLLDMGTGKR